MNRFVVFDVETPNFKNERMSSIGVAVVENGSITEEFYSLVDPEQHFDRFNIMLTGITPQMTAGSPAFAELWQRLEPLMCSGVLVAHNAPFDMSVLSACLNGYGINTCTQFYYACTCRMARKLDAELENHKLNTMCAHYGIALEHHNAMSDARACAELLVRYIGSGADIMQFLRRYDVKKRKTFTITGKEVQRFEDNLSYREYLL